MKRILLFLATNIAVMLVLSVSASLLGVNQYLNARGMNLGMLLAFAALMGFGGAFVSLWLSKPMAKWSTGARVIKHPADPTERWLVDTVAAQAQRAGIAMPEVAIYEGAPNAFATGATRNAALVAVSTGLLASMTRDEAEAVLAHEVSHIANGDMVTLTLIQGVVNTFVIFLARVVAWFVDQFLRRDEEHSSGPGLAYGITAIACELLFGILASVIVMFFSRQREYRADRGAAQLMGTPRSMIAALRRLDDLAHGVDSLPRNMAAAGIAGGGVASMFASHPSCAQRIAALQQAGALQGA